MRASVSAPALLIGAAVTTATGLAVDLWSGEHPTHTALLALAAAVVLALRRWGRGRGVAALPAACVAVMAGPVLHLGSVAAPPASLPHDHADVLHVVGSELPSAVLQIGIPAVILLVVATAAHLLHLIIGVIRCPMPDHRAAATPLPRVLGPIQSDRLGSMLRWCGWAIRAARRGPPARLLGCVTD